MDRICRAALWIGVALTAAVGAQGAASPFVGRWDLTIRGPEASYPSWMEYADEGGTPAVRIVGRTGSVHDVRNVKLTGTHLSFISTEETTVVWDLTVEGRKISGRQHRDQGPDRPLAGVPAPALRRAPPLAWADPEPLFNGRDLAGWEVDNPTANHWTIQNGELRNLEPGANIRTTRKFDDFKLHVEYNCPLGGNSGVYLRGRYEVQVEYEPAGKNDRFHGMGSIYGFIAPATEVSARPGQWEGYDITLTGRTVTVVRDGVLIIDHEQIPGITGGALDSNEAEPGPIYLQGDHSGGLKYRNITVSVPRH